MKSVKRYTRIKYHMSHTIEILFIGTNPSPGSYERGVPFSSNKLFWYLLHDAGLLPETREELRDDKRLKNLYSHDFTQKYHLALMNIIHWPTKTVAEVSREDAIPGSKRILSAIYTYRPAVVCFVGKGTYQLFAQKKQCRYGWQPPIGASKIFVMHSPIRGFARIRINELKRIAH
jgi:TDG/mug DNA glycosylase family protein